MKGLSPQLGDSQEVLPSCIPRAAATAAFYQSSSPTKSSDLRRQSYCNNVQISTKKNRSWSEVCGKRKKDKKIF